MNQKDSDNKYEEVKDFVAEANRLQSGVVNEVDADLKEFFIFLHGVISDSCLRGACGLLSL